MRYSINFFAYATLLMSSMLSAGQEVAISYHWQDVNGVNIFYRSAGNPENPAIVLLHGTPSSSIMYQDLMRLLKDEFYLIAPDYPAHGYSDTPAPGEYTYTFQNISETIGALLPQIGLTSYSLFMQDYGAPIGFRMALAHPRKIERLIIQNGNAYLEGFPLAQDPNGELQTYWRDKNKAYEDQWMNFYGGLQLAANGHWRHGAGVSPDRRALDIAVMRKAGTLEIFRDLWYDYGNNVKEYPLWQEYMKEKQPPALVLWGKGDGFFTSAGALAYRKDLPEAEIHLLNGGHWLATDDNPALVALLIREFFSK